MFIIVVAGVNNLNYCIIPFEVQCILLSIYIKIVSTNENKEGMQETQQTQPPEQHKTKDIVTTQKTHSKQ